MTDIPTNGTIGYVGTIETYTVQTTGTYDITAYGAEGGSSVVSGGDGAEISGDLDLTTGEVIEILVGGEGSSFSFNGGGGGGTFVVEVTGSTLTPLVVAGGGGGAGYSEVGSNGQIAASGNGGGAAGSGAPNAGAGGGGFAGDGGGTFISGDGGGAGGGSSFTNGGNGGGSGNYAPGGFGGGGGGSSGGGGGGGYSGGDGGGSYYNFSTFTGYGYGGGGGGSFLASDATNGSEQSGVSTSDGNGFVSFDLLCFLTGTLIATPDGERSVETLAIGDLVTTADGAPAPVRWIGHRTLHAYGKGGYRFADPLVYMPIRIKAGALGENLPQRDLFVSAEHALLVDGLLVQAGALVNGTSVVRQTRLPETFTFHHIELAEHALVLAESVPAETFVDNVHRMGFDNWAEHEALYGNEPSIVEMDYPRVQSLRQLPLEIRRLMRDRARALMVETTKGIAAA